jgi:diguanylate cyclase (GGDEF)-like protein/PAS domain S-box-containing protein
LVRELASLGVVLQFATLLLFGSTVATSVAVAVAALASLLASKAAGGVLRVVLDVLIAGLAMAAAGAAYEFLVQGVGAAWPRHALPIGFAALAYALVHGVGAAVVAPRLRHAMHTAWQQLSLAILQHSVIAATVAALLVELIEQRMWVEFAVAMVPLYFASRAHSDYLRRVALDDRHREVIDTVADGIAIIDRAGLITFWSDALERLLGAPGNRVNGQKLAAAIPALAKTELPRAIESALSTDAQMTVVEIALANPAGTRFVQVKVLPAAEGVTLVWHDVTERRREEQASRRQEERLSLAAAGASDGIWEWDLSAKELFVSARWNALLGRAAEETVVRPDEWLSRVHPDDIVSLREAIEAHLKGSSEVLRHEHRLRHEDGSYRWFLCHGIASRNALRRTVRLGGSLTETTDRVLAQERLQNAGFLDPLTGLYNRALFVERIGQRLKECKEARRGRFALLYLDLDRFKVVNDSLGHLVGDELLVAVSRRLESCVRAGDALARLGGDEFAILINSLAEDQQANAMAFRIQEALRAPLPIGGREVFTSASIGIAFGPALYNDPDEIMRDADTAMYHAKSHGKARHEVFDADMHARVRDRLGLESDLRHAVSSNDFQVHYQPIVLLTSGMCVGFESLVRWTRNGEPVSPATFVPMAEELGLIEPLGTWVLQQACRTFAEWQRRFPDAGLEYITVNVSGRQLGQHKFLRVVERAVLDSGLDPNALRIEITETALMDSPALASESLKDLRDLGVKIYLDDFGTGYSSLSHLHKLPVDALKIDRSFVKSLLLPDRPAIVESVLALARTLNTSVVAEGIESETQARELERLGCTHAQGFLFSRPLPTDKAEALIVARQPLGPKRESGKVVLVDADILVPAGPFEWPAHVSTR